MNPHNWYCVLIVTFYIQNSSASTTFRINTVRAKRSAQIIGYSVFVGLRAVRDLLSGSTRIMSASPTKQFVKSGGYEQAVEDFHYVHPNFVHSFELPGGTYVTAGRVGDRQLILRHFGSKQKPTLEIMQMTPLSSYPFRTHTVSKVTDAITYVD